MKIKNHHLRISQLFYLGLYYAIAIHLPATNNFFNIGGALRVSLCKRIFRKCGKNVNIEKGARFGIGINVELGDYSGIGINAVIPSDAQIGKYVMMGPNCYIINCSHVFDSTDKPMMFQGNTPKESVIIEDDVWIGRNVTILPGRTISKGTVIGACCVLTKDYPPYSVVAGNPGRLIRSRH